MMSVYMTEAEQLERIKNWWKCYGNIITICLSLIMLGIAGFKYYNWHEAKMTQQASILYENMMVAFSNQNIKSVKSYANQLTSEYKHSVYADAAHLTLAKLYIINNKLDKAKVDLQAVAQNSQMSSLKQIAKIRIARILTMNKSYDAALEELKQVVNKAYLPVINELKGDIYGAKGQYKEAIQSYQLAMKEVKANGMGNLFLEMKSNALALKNQSVAIETVKAAV